MRKLFFIPAFVLLVSGAAFGIHETIPSETQMVLPPADAGKLYDYLTKVRYTTWRTWPGKGKLYKGTEPHGALLTTYVNDAAFGAVRAKGGMPDGSIVAKENYGPDRKYAALTVMYKVKGYNPGAGDWFWAKYAPDGKVEASGMVKGCIDCHSKRMDNDYLFTGPVTAPKKKQGTSGY